MAIGTINWFDSPKGFDLTPLSKSRQQLSHPAIATRAGSDAPDGMIAAGYSGRSSARQYLR